MFFMMLLSCSKPSGVLYREQILPAIDMHLHTGQWNKISEQSQDFLASRFPFPFGLTPDALSESALVANGILKELDKGGLGYGFLFAVYAPRSVGVATNEFVLQQVQTSDRLYGLSSLSVEEWDVYKDVQLNALEKSLESNQMIGVKLAHTHQNFRMDDADYYDIYRVAGMAAAPVYIHTGSSPFPGTNPAPPYTDPRYLEEAIQLYPDTDFILGHMCYDFINEDRTPMQNCFDLAEKYENVWLEPSAFASNRAENSEALLQDVYAELKERGLIGKIIYGSDGPQRPGFADQYAQKNAQAMQGADYSIEEATQVLSGNAIQLFQLPEVELP